MNFASDYVYDYDDAEYEYISDEELQGGLVVSDSESDDDDKTSESKYSNWSFLQKIATSIFGSGSGDKAKKEKPAPKAKSYGWKKGGGNAAGKKGKKVRKADTNIVSIKFDELVSPNYMHTGDAVYCSACGAILSSISKVTVDGPDKIWECEFCYERNKVDIELEEVPKVDDVTFMLEPAIAKPAQDQSVSEDESLVVFCVDISGSMSQTTSVPGKVSFRGTNIRNRGYNEASDKTSVSRLQAVQAAVDHQLEEMCKSHPNRRVALITFSSQVFIVGDGQGTPRIVGDSLENKQALMDIGREINLPKPISESRDLLGQKIFQLRPTDMTALGPALVISIAMAGAHAGSKVVICTDGQANVGIGALNNMNTDVQTEAVQQVYEDFGNMAVEMGVVVSVISIKGTDCRLSQLGRVADITGGQVNIVDPMKLKDEFSTVLADQTVATNVVATCILHKELCFLYEDTVESKIVKTIGNVSYDTEITFEFGIKSALSKKKQDQDKACSTIPEETDKTENESGDKPTTEQEGKAEEADKPSGSKEEKSSEAEGATSNPTPATRSRPSKMPFQLQLCYTDKSGNRALRVHTNQKPLTRDRRKAERVLNAKLVGHHTACVGSKLALMGEYTHSRSHQLMNQRMVHRNASTPTSKEAYKKVFSKVQLLENNLLSVQSAERKEYGKSYSDDEEEEEQDLTFFTKVMKKKGAKLHSRGREVSDEVYNNIYEAKRSDYLK